MQYPSTISLPMLSLAAVKYVIYSEHMAARHRSLVNIPPGLKEQEAAGGLIFFENLSALPRFRIVHDVIPVEGEQRGDGRRTYVHVEGVASPIVASRSERAILADVEDALVEAAGLPRGEQPA